MPRIATSLNCLRSRLNRIPRVSAASSTGQKPRSSGAPDKASHDTPVRKRAKGAKTANGPP